MTPSQWRGQYAHRILSQRLERNDASKLRNACPVRVIPIAPGAALSRSAGRGRSIVCMAERFSSSQACQGSPFGRPPEAAALRAVLDKLARMKKNDLHANNGFAAMVAGASEELRGQDGHSAISAREMKPCVSCPRNSIVPSHIYHGVGASTKSEIAQTAMTMATVRTAIVTNISASLTFSICSHKPEAQSRPIQALWAGPGLGLDDVKSEIVKGRWRGALGAAAGPIPRCRAGAPRGR
jgi:hypothetical protein